MDAPGYTCRIPRLFLGDDCSYDHLLVITGYFMLFLWVKKTQTVNGVISTHNW